MRFCDVCRNMLYMKLVDGKLSQACPCCSSVYEMANESAPVSETNYRDDKAKYHHMVTPLIHSDPTLPRVSNIKCKNDRCTKAEGLNDSVLYIKYDSQNLKFLYSCCHCKAFWGPDDLGVSVGADPSTPDPYPEDDGAIGRPSKIPEQRVK